MIDKMIIQPVKFMPEDFTDGVIYYSEKYKVAGHLCACGCGEKVITPIGPAAWSINTTDKGAKMWPSIGNWQLPCRSHYIIKDGAINWAGEWTNNQIEHGRSQEIERKTKYYEARNQSWFRKLATTLRKILSRLFK